MLSFLCDTNLWLRSVDTDSPQHAVAVAAMEIIARRAELVILPQILVEFWAVATRPTNSNGLGWTTDQAATRLVLLQERFQLLAETSELFDQWFELVRSRRISGKRVHDARIAAGIITAKIDFLVTFNVSDFESWPIKALHPGEIEPILCG